MDALSVLTALTALNNRATEAFKLILRDHVPDRFVNEELRRVLTLLFSVLFGIGSVYGAVLSGVEFGGSWLDPFLHNIHITAIVGGASVSMVSAIVQPVIERLKNAEELPTQQQQVTS